MFELHVYYMRFICHCVNEVYAYNFWRKKFYKGHTLYFTFYVMPAINRIFTSVVFSVIITL